MQNKYIFALYLNNRNQKNLDKFYNKMIKLKNKYANKVNKS